MMWLRSGRLIDPLNIDFTKVELTDIAWALAHVNRWGGHADPPISVAQHAVACCRAAWPNARLALLALHHDDGEAFFLDMPRDLKGHPEMAWYREQEHRATELCVRHFAPECDGMALRAVKEFDTQSLLTERATRFPESKDETSYHPELAPMASEHFALDPMRIWYDYGPFGRRDMPGPGGLWARSWLWCHHTLKRRLELPSMGNA